MISLNETEFWPTFNQFCSCGLAPYPEHSLFYNMWFVFMWHIYSGSPLSPPSLWRKNVPSFMFGTENFSTVRTSCPQIMMASSISVQKCHEWFHDSNLEFLFKFFFGFLLPFLLLFLFFLFRSSSFFCCLSWSFLFFSCLFLSASLSFSKLLASDLWWQKRNNYKQSKESEDSVTIRPSNFL